MASQLNTIEEVLQDVRQGKPVIIVDDDNRENEGDVVIAAQFASQETINFMVKEARGIVCTPMRREALAHLDIGPMVTHNTDNHETAFTVSVDQNELTPCKNSSILHPNQKTSVDQAMYSHSFIRREGSWFETAIQRHLLTFVALLVSRKQR